MDRRHRALSMGADIVGLAPAPPCRSTSAWNSACGTGLSFLSGRTLSFPSLCFWMRLHHTWFTHRAHLMLGLCRLAYRPDSSSFCTRARSASPFSPNSKRPVSFFPRAATVHRREHSNRPPSRRRACASYCLLPCVLPPVPHRSFLVHQFTEHRRPTHGNADFSFFSEPRRLSVRCAARSPGRYRCRQPRRSASSRPMGPAAAHETDEEDGHRPQSKDKWQWQTVSRADERSSRQLDDRTPRVDVLPASTPTTRTGLAPEAGRGGLSTGRRTSCWTRKRTGGDIARRVLYGTDGQLSGASRPS